MRFDSVKRPEQKYILSKVRVSVFTKRVWWAQFQKYIRLVSNNESKPLKSIYLMSDVYAKFWKFQIYLLQSQAVKEIMVHASLVTLVHSWSFEFSNFLKFRIYLLHASLMKFYMLELPKFLYLPFNKRTN